MEGSGRGLIKALSQYLSGGLRKITNNLSQYNRSPGRNLNPGSLEYEAGVLTTRRVVTFNGKTINK
jgi:hypothetical protein